MSQLPVALSSDHTGSLYEVSLQTAPGVRSLIFSAPETRAICNDPMVMGTTYTRKLQHACASALKHLAGQGLAPKRERDTTVLHVLRGGLNFGVREALTDAFGWNLHQSAFVSAQRARRDPHSSEWIITESDYRKISLRPLNTVVFGDVVATGVSLEFALQRLVTAAKEANGAIDRIIFFTIGGKRSSEILSQLVTQLRTFGHEVDGIVVYFEGVFAVAGKESSPSHKILGTDLLRTDSLLAPEFVLSQGENPSYPLERCTIYDAGSRAFDVEEYLLDVQEYWEYIASEAEKGTSYEALLADRFPELPTTPFQGAALAAIASSRLAAIKEALGEGPRKMVHRE